MALAARRSRPGGDFSGRRTWPPSSPPAVGVESETVALETVPAAALQLGESDTTRSAGAGLSRRPVRRRPRSRPPAGPGTRRYPAPGVESDAQLRRAWGRTVRAAPGSRNGGTSASPAVAASWAGARCEAAGRPSGVDDELRRSSWSGGARRLTTCRGTGAGDVELEPDADPWTKDQRRRAQPARRAECGAIDDDGEDGGAVDGIEAGPMTRATW